MPAVVLEDSEWQVVLAILSTAPWRDANPLMMKIGTQLRTQAEFKQHGVPPADVQQKTEADARGNGGST